MIPKEYYGRLFTKEQLPVDYLSEAVKLESMIKVDKKLRCKRCYSRMVSIIVERVLSLVETKKEKNSITFPQKNQK